MIKMKLMNSEKEYVCVRVQIVRVKKGMFGYNDKILGATTVIPDTVKHAEVIFNRVKRMFSKEGVKFEVE